MNESPETTSLRDYLRVLRSQRTLILSAVAVAAIAALAYSLVKSPTYKASADVSFTDETKDLQLVGTSALPSAQPQQQAIANAKIATRDDVVDRVDGVIDADLSRDELKDSVSTELDTDSNLIKITASASKPELAADIANEFARQSQAVARAEARARYSSAARELQGKLKRLGPSLPVLTQQAYQDSISRLLSLTSIANPVEISRPASPPGSPASPKPIRDVFLAAALGLILGIAAAFLRNSLDRRLSDSRQVQHQVDLPLVGYVRADALGLAGLARNGRGRISEDDLEAFRILRTNVDFLAKEGPVKSLLVTSPLPEEGKSTVASGYAYASAVAGRRTLLVECDFRRPVLAQRLELERAPGLTEYLTGVAGPKDILRSIPVEGPEAVELLPTIVAGTNAIQPTELLGSRRFQEFLDQVQRAYDVVVMDCAPLLPVGDTLEMVPEIDGVLLCVRLGQTTRDQARAAKDALGHFPDRPTGLVVTGVSAGSEDDYYGYYSYTPSWDSARV